MSVLPVSYTHLMWGSDITRGEALKSTEITRKVLAFLSAQLGKNLNNVLWSAVRKDDGELSKDLSIASITR